MNKFHNEDAMISAALVLTEMVQTGGKLYELNTLRCMQLQTTMASGHSLDSYDLTKRNFISSKMWNA